MYVSNSHLQNKCALRSCLDVDTILWSLIVFESTIFTNQWKFTKKNVKNLDKFLDSNPSKIEWDLTNGPLSKLLELLDTPV